MPVIENPTFRRFLLVCPENLSPREARLARGLAAKGDLTVLVPSLRAAVEDGEQRVTHAAMIDWRGLRNRRRDWQPDFVVYASPPTPALHWKVWWWKRRRAPGALLGGCWRVPAAGPKLGAWGRWIAARALDSLDFWFAEDEAGAGELARVGVPARRLLVLGGEGTTETVGEFLEGRRRAEVRSVLWVDDELSLKSPSTKHLVYSLPHLQAEGWEVRGWCVSADAALRDAMEVREFPAAPGRLRLFSPYWFFGAVNLHGIGQTILKGRPPARIVHTVGGAFLGADMASVQFVNHVWLRKQIALGPRSLKDVAAVGLTVLGLCKDQLQFSNPRCGLLLPASDSIGEEVRRRCLPRAEVKTLANSYDESRFNPEVRRQWREPMRTQLGFGADDTVFSFASQGHYKRKGFWLAAEALARLRRRRDVKTRGVKFLVIGGQPGTLERLQAELAGPYPDWKDWMVFAGSQPAVEPYLSAADAFLFPSYFEAFCLAEIEAGAMGLPLLLTAHPGTEMILQDGINGMRLSYDQAELTARVGEFLDRGLPPFAASAGRALDRAGYARTLAGFYDEWLKARGGVGA